MVTTNDAYREKLEQEAKQVLKDDRADFTHRVQAQSVLMVTKEGVTWL